MNDQEVARRVAAFKADMSAKGVGADAIEAALADIVRTEKSADEVYTAFKSADAPTIYTLPDGTPGVIQDGQWVALKATVPYQGLDPWINPTTKAAVGAPVAEVEEEIEEKAPIEVGADASEMSYLGDMDPSEYWGEIDTRLARIEQALNIEDRINKAFGEVKSLLGGVATKDDARAAEIASLKEQQTKLDARLKELEGDQPRIVAPAEIEAALKSTGPQAAPDPTAPQIPNDPARPMANIAARLMPELYTPWDGSTIPPAASVPQPQSQPTNGQPQHGWPTAGQSNNS